MSLEMWDGQWIDARMLEAAAAVLRNFEAQVFGPASNPPATLTPSLTLAAPLVDSLRLTIACLERYCTPGSRGYEVAKTARQTMKDAGIQEIP